jgi:hypothetical protein
MTSDLVQLAGVSLMLLGDVIVVTRIKPDRRLEPLTNHNLDKAIDIHSV